MKSENNEQRIDEYLDKGFTIFRNVIPKTLLTDLRKEANKGRTIARELAGPNAQRLQPIVDYPQIDMTPFDELDHLPALQNAFNEMFAEAFGGPVDMSSNRKNFGILYEPANTHWCMHWHRDFRDFYPVENFELWHSLIGDLRYFNQSNIALYDDNCLWVVPGSHFRDDTPAEIRQFPTRPIEFPRPRCADHNQNEVVRIFEGYARSMPNAMQVCLKAGDYLLLRDSIWHTGVYNPDHKRATIHTGLMTREFEDYLKTERAKDNNFNFQTSQNPNEHTPTYQAMRFSLAVNRVRSKVKRLSKPRNLANAIARRVRRISGNS